MKKIDDIELLVLFWTDSVVNSSVNYYKKSKFLQAWVLKFSANVQARSSVVWFLKQSTQMCLLQSPQATLHHVSLFPLNSAYSDLWRTLWANAKLCDSLSGRGNFLQDALLISTTSSTDINAISKQIFCESKRIEKIINKNMMVFAYLGLSEIVDNMVSYQ